MTESYDEGWADAFEGKSPRKAADKDYRAGYNDWFRQVSP